MTQAKLNNQGLKDIKEYILENGMSPEEMIKESQKADPLLVRSMESKIHNVEDAIKLTGKVAKARSFQDIFSFLDVPINWIQEKTENFPYFKLAVFTAGLKLFFEVLQAGADLGIEDGGVYFLATVIVMLGFSGLVYAYQYFFGNIDTWLRKRIAMVKAWVVLIPFRVMSFALKTFGWILDNVIGGIKGAWNKFFSRQASIAMQYPEFKRAYYSI
ncbi:hypothetical protein EB001_26060 [bacterium]|nr:hypothetical protein [bacterium]